MVLSTGEFGPPPPGMFFLIIGRALTTLQGVVVHPTLVKAHLENSSEEERAMGLGMEDLV